MGVCFLAGFAEVCPGGESEKSELESPNSLSDLLTQPLPNSGDLEYLRRRGRLGDCVSTV